MPIYFPKGTLFDELLCTDGYLLAGVKYRGRLREVVGVGTCPHCGLVGPPMPPGMLLVYRLVCKQLPEVARALRGPPLEIPKTIVFPDGTDFDDLLCLEGSIVAVVKEGDEWVDRMVLGPCPHCREPDSYDVMPVIFLNDTF